MNPEGRVEGLGVADLLQWLGRSRRKGVLRVERAGFRKHIGLAGGRIVSCSTARAKERLGSLLMVNGRVVESQVRAALQLQSRTRLRFGEALLQLGYLSLAELRQALSEQTRQSLIDVLTWQRPWFRFDESAVASAAGMPPPRCWKEVLHEDVPRAEARLRRSRSHPERGATFKVDWSKACAMTDVDELSSSILSLASTGITAAEICLRLHERDGLILDRLADYLSGSVLSLRSSGSLAKRPASPEAALQRVGTVLEAGEILEALLQSEESAERWPERIDLGRCRRSVRGWARSRACRVLGDLDSLPLLRDLDEAGPRGPLESSEDAILGAVDGRTSFRLIARLVPFGEPIALAALAQLWKRGMLS